MKGRTLAVLCLLPVLLFALTGCIDRGEPKATPTPRVFLTPTPVPTLSQKAANLLTSVETDQLMVSLVFQGYADETMMEDVFRILKKHDVDGLFFVDGQTANEHPEVVSRMVEEGFDIGNSGIVSNIRMDRNTATSNAHSFERTQALINAAGGFVPKYVLCGGTNYTTEMLQAVTAGGLQGAVQPDVYLNYDSFLEREEVDAFVESLIRGSIISVQLGHVTGDFEVANASLREQVSIDPTPSIVDESNLEMLKTPEPTATPAATLDPTGRAARPTATPEVLETEETYTGIAKILNWLLESLKLYNYKMVTPLELQSAATNLIGTGMSLPDSVLELFNADTYALPVTAKPLGATVTRRATAGDFAYAVFVGDSIMANLMSYVEWRRESDPTFWEGAQFLVSSRLSMEKALISDEGAPELPMVAEQRIHIDDALKLLGAKRVYICLRCDNIRAYSEPRYLNNMRVLISQILQKNPEIEIIVMSVPPVILARNATPSNKQIFTYNLMLAKLCTEHGIPFLDIAYALRNAKGGLREEYCLDPDLYGMHLNDAGCQALISYIQDNIP